MNTITTGIEPRLKRLRLEANISQKDLAFEAGCSRHAVMRMEQLCFPNPLPNVISALSDLLGVSEAMLIHEYESDVYSNRRHSGTLYGLNKVTDAYVTRAVRDSLLPLSNSHSAFGNWRKALARGVGDATSQVHFSSRFSIHPAIISKFEANGGPFPLAIATALTFGGLPTNVCDIMHERFSGVTHD
jgi:transcriptional regulator with XRE-family HTH domain